MTYLEAKTAQAAIDADVSRAGKVLQNFPKGPMNLTQDSTKASPEYRAAKAAFDAAFDRLRRFNGEFVKTFAKEIRAERNARCAPWCEISEGLNAISDNAEEWGRPQIRKGAQNLRVIADSVERNYYDLKVACSNLLKATEDWENLGRNSREAFQEATRDTLSRIA